MLIQRVAMKTIGINLVEVNPSTNSDIYKLQLKKLTMGCVNYSENPELAPKTGTSFEEMAESMEGNAQAEN